MIPPCDPAILENNPQFKKLYQHLTTELLNPDGSTRANDAHPARKAVQNVSCPEQCNCDPWIVESKSQCIRATETVSDE